MNKKLEIKRLMGEPTMLFEKFHWKTKLNKKNDFIRDNQIQKLPLTMKQIHFKAYARFKKINLRKKNFTTRLKEALIKRRSKRSLIGNKPITIDKLGTLLYYSAGLDYYNNKYDSRRLYPSAGARYPLEIYLLPRNIQSLNKRYIYHYNVKEHSLEGRLASKYKLNNLFQQDFVKSASAIILISGVFKRTHIKYGDRGYRYTLIECGHLGQNLYLVAEAIKVNICAICGFYDNEINKLLHLDGITEAILYCFAIY